MPKKGRISKDLKELMLFISTFDHLQEGGAVFGQLNKLFKKSFDCKPLVVFSKPKDATRLISKDVMSTCRVIFNRHNYKKEYRAEAINSVLSQLLEDGPIKGRWVRYEHEEEGYYILYCGENEKQTHFGVWSCRDEVESLYLDFLVKFMNTHSLTQTRLDELRKLENLVYIDDVTGLYNQRKLMKDLDYSIIRHQELKEEFSVLFIDIDHFKEVNDGHGHLLGTQLLSEMGKILKKTLRESDLVYRYGGDEFVMVVPDVGADIAKVIGDRVLNVVKKMDFEVLEHEEATQTESFRLSISIGVAGFPRDAQTKEEILSIADKMMYEAKQGGRGRVCYASEIFAANNKKKV